MKKTMAWLALCAAPLLAQAQDNCTSPNSNDDYILGTAEDGTASAMHWPTGLVWKRCSEGQVFDAGQCTGTAQAKPWDTWAAMYLPQPFAGQMDWGISTSVSENRLASGTWRMAYKNELQGITTNCGSGPKVNREVFSGTPPSSFVWSGSPYTYDSNAAWGVGLNNGVAYGGSRDNGGHVRLVRGGQSFAALSSFSTSGYVGQQTDFAPIMLASSTGNGQAWGGARISGDGNPQFQVNGGAWVQQAIVKSGDQIVVRLTAQASGVHTATLTLRSGHTTGTSANATNGSYEATTMMAASASFTLTAVAAPVDGACGSAHGVVTVAAPDAANLCSAGAASALTGDASGWAWKCDGSNGGTQAACQAPKGYTVTPSVSGNGNISPSTPQVVEVNTSASFTIMPQAGYSAAVGGTCGGNLSGSTYTTHPTTADCTVEASFTAIASHAITTSASPAHGGAVVCAPNPVLAGGSTTCVARSNAYRFTAWTGACAGQTGPTCTLNNVTAAPTVGTQWDTSTVLSHTLNDTGVSLSGASNSVNASTCDPTHPSAQDCHHGRDAGALSGQLSKVGASASTSNGFDYTKVCNSGELAGQGACSNDPVLGNGANDWACTRDNVTGLIWEVKTTSGLRDQDYLYTWFNPHSPDGDPGAENPSTFDCETAGRCDTAKFVEDVNAASLCGARDWRLPTVQELGGLVDMGQQHVTEAAIDPAYFPNTPLMPFWSSTPFANAALVGGVASAWFVDFDHDSACGGDCFTDRVWPMSVRLVRSGQ